MDRLSVLSVIVSLIFITPAALSEPLPPLQPFKNPPEFYSKTTAFGMFNRTNLTENQTEEAPEYVPGEVIVKFKESGRDVEDKVKSFLNGEATKKFKASSVKKLLEKARGKAKKGEKFSNVFKVKIGEKANVLEAVQEFRKNPEIEYAEPNYILKTTVKPNDPDFSQQYAHSKIQSELAWNITQGNKSVVIAIVDTGVDWNHPDLAANIWNNTAEIPGNGIDDDSNGFIDDIRGYDFTDTNSSWCSDTDCITRDNDPMDFNGHGTHCSGIAGAVANNSLGIAGLCWNCSIMPSRAGYDTILGGALEIDDAAEAIIYAADNGADIISMSWGGNTNSSLIYDAIEYAYSNGVVLVASAGNSYSSYKLYPSGYDKVIAVSATDGGDEKAYFTSYGDWVDVAAPGVDIYSTIVDGYETFSGTSMAAPLVAGLAGLILSRNSSLPSEEVRSILKSSTDPVISDVFMGFGRVNAYKALQINTPGTADITYPDMESVLNGTIEINGTSEGSDFKNYTIEYGEGLYPTSWSSLNQSDTQVVEGVLAEWDTSLVDDGIYIIRLTTNTNEGWSEDRVYIMIISDFERCFSCRDCEYKLEHGGMSINLSNDINTSDTCIQSFYSNSIFDCGGHNITGVGSGYGIYTYYDNNVTIRNCVVNNFSRAIYIYGSDYNNLLNNTVQGSEYGIYLRYSSLVNLSDNSLSDNQRNIYVYGYSYDYNHTIDQSNTVDGYPVNYIYNQSGIVIDNLTTGHITIVFSDNVTVRNVTIGSGDPISVIEAENATISGNNINNSYYGIYLEEVKKSRVFDNVFEGNAYGIYIDGSELNNISNNSMSNISGYGFYIDFYSYYNYIDQLNKVDGQNVSYFYNMHGNESNYIKVSGSVLNSTNIINLGLITLVNSSYLNITDNSVSGSVYCISALYSDNITIYNNSLANCSYAGIGLEYSDWNTISDNSIEESYIAIDIVYSENNIISGNSISNSSSCGIYLFFGENNLIANNSISDVPYGFKIYSWNDSFYNNSLQNVSLFGFYMMSPYNYISQDNTVDGQKPYHYFNLHGNESDYVNISGIEVNASKALYPACLEIINSTFVNISNISVYNCGYGIMLHESNECILNDNPVENSSVVGMYLVYSNNNTVDRNVVQESFYSMVTVSSYNNTLRNNSLLLNSYGAYISSSYNNLIENLTSNSNEQDGILFDWSSSNTLKDSYIDNSMTYGIHLGSLSSNNLIYNNYFNNTQNYQSDTEYLNYFNISKTAGTNIIGGLYLGGNYWSDYDGSDPDGDRLGDDVHNLDGMNADYRPLTYDITAPIISSQDVFPRTIIKGENVTLSVIVSDFNLSAVWFNLSNSSWSSSAEMTGTDGLYNYTLNTSGFANDVYNIRIHANDSLGQESNISAGILRVSNETNINLSVFDYTGIPLNVSKIMVFYNRTGSVRTESQVNISVFKCYIPEYFWDIKMIESGFNQTFYDVDIRTSIEGDVSLDIVPRENISSPVPNVAFHEIVAIETGINFSMVQVGYNYNSSLFQNEERMVIYACHNWGISDRTCLDIWENITDNSSIYTDQDMVVINASGLSSFSFSETLPYCGDGKKDPGEDCVTCPQDASCPEGYFCNPSTHACEKEGNGGIIIGGSTAILRIVSYPQTPIASPEEYVNFEIIINNTGTRNLTQVIVYVDLDFSADVSIVPNNISLITGESRGIGIYFTVPSDLSSGNYSVDITVNSSENANHDVSVILQIPDEFICSDGDTKKCGEKAVGACEFGTMTCQDNHWEPCEGAVYPESEVCNGIDDDCDGEIDDNAGCCLEGGTRACGPANETGECKKGAISCVNGLWSEQCIGAVLPIDEVCWDGKDNDCDGDIDDGCDAEPCGNGKINQTCICEGSVRETGYCCSGIYSEQECQQSFWWILMLIGVIMLAITGIYVIFIREQGTEKKLTWEDLEKKYT